MQVMLKFGESIFFLNASDQLQQSMVDVGKCLRNVHMVRVE